MAEVQRAVRVAVAESRANERLRVHRMLDVPLSQRNHGGGLRQGSYLRVHGNHGAVDANARTVATTPTNSVSNSIPSISEDEKEAATQLQTVSGSVSICGVSSSRCRSYRLLAPSNRFSELLELRQTSVGNVRWLRNSAILWLLLSTPRLGGRRSPRDV